MIFKGSPVALVAEDIQRAAITLGVTAAHIRAVLAVEAGGRGFIADGRLKMLFEEHIFSRLTGHRYDQIRPSCSAPRWDRARIQNQAGEYAQLEEAMRLDETAALKSASWGLFQIMGENHQLCGYSTVQLFVEALAMGEAWHLNAFVGYVVSRGLVDELRAGAASAASWQAFARAYNGPGFAANRYDVKLADAFGAARSKVLA